MPAEQRGAGAAWFPATRASLMAAVCDPDPEARRRAWDELVESYWRPVYKYLRWRWGERPAEAEDLTQEFLAAAFGGDLVERFDPRRARFRTYLRLCLDGFVLNQRKAAGRLKRGGGRAALPLDYAAAEAELAASGPFAGGAGVADPEALFHREWVRSLFSLAVADLHRDCDAAGRGVLFTVFARYDLAGVDAAPRAASAPADAGRPSYAELAAELGIPLTQVTNHLAAARRRFRALVLVRLRRMTASEGELRAEARALLGMELEPGALATR